MHFEQYHNDIYKYLDYIKTHGIHKPVSEPEPEKIGLPCEQLINDSQIAHGVQESLEHPGVPEIGTEPEPESDMTKSELEPKSSPSWTTHAPPDLDLPRLRSAAAHDRLNFISTACEVINTLGENGDNITKAHFSDAAWDMLVEDPKTIRRLYRGRMQKIGEKLFNQIYNLYWNWKCMRPSLDATCLKERSFS